MSFEERESSLAGKETEDMVIEYSQIMDGWKLLERSSGYVKEKDATFLVDDIEIDIEVKLDAYTPEVLNSPFRPIDFIPIEFEQHNRQGVMVSSGIDVCTAKYFYVYCKRQYKLYIFDTQDLKNFIRLKRYTEIRLCNLNEEGNNTKCYMIDSGALCAQYNEHGGNEDTYKIIDMTEYIKKNRSRFKYL